MILFPNAKINIGLFVRNKRKDGFHNIETVFYPIRIKDAIEVVNNNKKGNVFTTSGINISGNIEDNLCYKAYNLLKSKYDINDIRFHLYKNIPIGAGLGGGSSDATSMLKLLICLFDLPIKKNELIEMSRLLGTDCAFFVKNRPVLAYEKGDVFEEIDISFLKKYFFIVVKPYIHINTAEAYQSISLSNDKNSLKELIKLPIEEWKNYLSNDFEPVVFAKHPIISQIKEILYANNAVYASMSGSGSAVYGIFQQELDLSKYFKEYFYFAGSMNYEDL